MALVFNYTWPNTGATAPTPLQVGARNVRGAADEVRGQLTTDGSATTATISHDMNISSADLVNGFPDVFFEPLSNNFLSLCLIITGKATNLLGLTFNAVASQFNFVIKRPHTVGR